MVAPEGRLVFENSTAWEPLSSVTLRSG